MTVVKLNNKTSPSLRPCIPVASDRSVGYYASHLLWFLVTILVFRAAQSFHDKESAMAFYGVYHREPLNQIIHFFGVPIIISTAFIYGSHLPLTHAVVLDAMPWIPSHYLSWASIWFAFYVGFYASVDAIGAVLYFPVLYVMYALAVRWTVSDQQRVASLNKSKTSASSWIGTGRLLQWALCWHVFAWYIQIHPGHKVIEGAQPAVLQSLGGALTTAPLFAFYEGIWFCGFRRPFHENVMELVDTYTRELCDTGAVNMRACTAAPIRET